MVTLSTTDLAKIVHIKKEFRVESQERESPRDLSGLRDINPSKIFRCNGFSSCFYLFVP